MEWEIGAVVKNENHRANWQKVAWDVAKAQEEGDYIVEEHLLKVWAAFCEEYMSDQWLYSETKVDQTVNKNSFIDFDERNINETCL